MALSLEIMSLPDVIFGIDDLTRKLLIRKLVFHEMIVSDKTASWKIFNSERIKSIKSRNKNIRRFNASKH